MIYAQYVFPPRSPSILETFCPPLSRCSVPSPGKDMPNTLSISSKHLSFDASGNHDHSYSNLSLQNCYWKHWCRCLGIVLVIQLFSSTYQWSRCSFPDHSPTRRSPGFSWPAGPRTHHIETPVQTIHIIGSRICKDMKAVLFHSCQTGQVLYLVEFGVESLLLHWSLVLWLFSHVRLQNAVKSKRGA